MHGILFILSCFSKGQCSKNVETEESDCRKRRSQLREEIRLARISMREMRGKIQQQQDIRSEKKRPK